MASHTPPEIMPKFVEWIMQMLEQDNRVTMTQVWMELMPEEVFAGVTTLIRDSLVADDWSELTKRIPELA